MATKSKYLVRAGDKVRINHMEGEPWYTGREGIVRHIDDIGQIHGSWGGCALNMDDDWYIMESPEVEGKEF